MAKVTYSDRKAQGKLSNLKKFLQDMTPVYKEIADLEHSQTLQRFKRQVEPDGTPWAEPFTIRKGSGPETGSGARSEGTFTRPWDYVRASNYQATPPGYRFFNAAKGDKIGRDSGSLFLSITRVYGPDYAIVGSNREYADDFQNGTGPRQPRPFIGINDKTITNIERTVRKFFGRITK